MQQIKWLKTSNGWGTKIGVYMIEVVKKNKKFRVEIYFNGDFITACSFLEKERTFVLSDALKYFYKVLNGRTLDRYLVRE